MMLRVMWPGWDTAWLYYAICQVSFVVNCENIIIQSAMAVDWGT